MPQNPLLLFTQLRVIARVRAVHGGSHESTRILG
jgi:hypothetical protein